jgi:hypothetical protein
MTFADRIGNAQRGIGPLHCTSMFPGSATPEEWITGQPEVTTLATVRPLTVLAAEDNFRREVWRERHDESTRGLLRDRAAFSICVRSRVQPSVGPTRQDDLTTHSEQTEICKFRYSLSALGARFQIACSTTYAEMQDEDFGT